MSDCLLEPDHWLVRTFACIVCDVFIFGDAIGVPGWGKRNNYEQGVYRSRDVGKEGGLGEGVDVVGLKEGGSAERMGEGRHYLGVIL